MKWIRAIAFSIAAMASFTPPSAAQISSEPSDAGDGRRVALVIGNAAYGELGVLTNPVRDAATVAKALGDSGFTSVTMATDLNIDAFQRHLREFRRVADGASVAVIYFAGHGMETYGKNWLIPLAANMTKAENLPLETIPVDLLLTSMGGATTKVLVLDACRNNPFERAIRLGAGAAVRTNNQGAGLAPIGQAALPNGMLVMYATEPGATASDGLPTDANSPFARALASELPTRGVDMRLVAGGVTERTMALTGGVQRPFVTSLLGRQPVYLAAAAAAPPPTSTPSGDALRMFNRAKVAGEQGDCQALVDLMGVFPSGEINARARAAAQTCRSTYLARLSGRDRVPADRVAIDKVAIDHGVRPETLRAVMRVEGGRDGGYAPDGRLLILFEPQLFSRLTARKYDQSHPALSTSASGRIPYPRTQAERWNQLAAAYALDPETAVAATSWGTFQLLGMNYRGAGYGSATEFIAAITRSEVAQARAFISYVQSIGALDELQRLDWDGFVFRYNGPTRGVDGQLARRMAEEYSNLMRMHEVAPPPPPIPAAVAVTETPGLVIPDLGEPASRSPALAFAFVALGFGALLRRRAA